MLWRAFNRAVKLVVTSGTISSLVVWTVMELKYGGTATYLNAVSSGI